MWFTRRRKLHKKSSNTAPCPICIITKTMHYPILRLPVPAIVLMLLQIQKKRQGCNAPPLWQISNYSCSLLSPSLSMIYINKLSKIPTNVARTIPLSCTSFPRFIEIPLIPTTNINAVSTRFFDFE